MTADEPVDSPQRGSAMTRSHILMIQCNCWVAVLGFAAASARFAWQMNQVFAQAVQPGLIMCASSVTGPLGTMLGFGTPVAMCGVVGLACLAHRGLASRASVVSAGMIALGCTAALLVFGYRFFGTLPGFHLSGVVWWMNPLGL
jgi:hypothetical protein